MVPYTHNLGIFVTDRSPKSLDVYMCPWSMKDFPQKNIEHEQES